MLDEFEALMVLGVAVQVMPGEANKGLFIDLKEPSPGAGEVSPNVGSPKVQCTQFDSLSARNTN